MFEALSSPPVVTRVHGDYHLGQVLIAPDGFRVVDFEGEPCARSRSAARTRSPLRDVASMLRSLDHVGRSAGRRAEARNGGRARAAGPRPRRLAAAIPRAVPRGLPRGLREAGAPIVGRSGAVRAFEIEKECYEFIYAATYLPSWLYAPTEGMRGLFE